MPIPDDWEPEDHPIIAHPDCDYEARQREAYGGMVITHDMAMDAEDPDLEGLPF